MKKTACILFYTILGSLLAAQNVSTFSKLYTVIPGMRCESDRINVCSGGYMIYGGTYDSNNLAKVVMLKIDTLGNLVWKKSYGKSGYDYFDESILSGGGGGVPVPWGGYIEIGTIMNASETWQKLAFYRFDGNGDTLWTKIYTDSTNELGVTVKVTREKDYIAGGNWYNNNCGTLTLKKTDTLGNTIWQRTYHGAPSHYREGIAIDTCKDEGYIVSAVDVDSDYECGYSIFIMKTDSAGTPQWTQSMTDPICGDEPYYILSLHDGSYLVAAGYADYFTLDFGGDQYGKMYLAKISSAGTVIWAKQYGAGSWGGAALFSLKELANGDIIACGTDSISNGFTSPISCPYGCILKVDSNGNQIWLRYYAMQAPAEQDILLDIQLTSDGGYVSAGLTYPGSGGSTQNIWVVKTDSLGCDTVDCNFASGVTELNNENENVKVYPNPSNGKFNIVICHPELVSGSQTSLKIYDVLGKEVYYETLNQVQGDNNINLSSQPSGVYFYRVLTNSGSLIGEGKIIIQK